MRFDRLASYETARAEFAWDLPATFNFAVRALSPESNPRVQVSPQSVTLASGTSQTLTVSLSGTKPPAGSYEGFIDVTGAGSTCGCGRMSQIAIAAAPNSANPSSHGSFVRAGGGGGSGTGGGSATAVVSAPSRGRLPSSNTAA